MVRVVFVHPDLGIGGAERLVVDAALALQRRGHQVQFFTAHHDPTHCFPETSDGRLPVTCVGDWLPRTTLGRLAAFWAYLRMVYVALYLVLVSGVHYDVLFVDQVSACIPFLRLHGNPKILFYCHYPDQLLTDRQGLLKRVYRWVLDGLEERTTAWAHTVLVNSHFTAEVYRNTFPSIPTSPAVLYPSLNFDHFDQFSSLTLSEVDIQADHRFLFLSLNRYERKKNLGLALDAMQQVLAKVDPQDKPNVHLVMAGGYDQRVHENVTHYQELVAQAAQLGITSHVTFLKSPSDKTKVALLKAATCLLYTPDKEHFGIVPIEAMYLGTPVVAVNSGGPRETVVSGETGFLCQQTPEEFSRAMLGFINGEYSKKILGEACHQRVVNHFSFDKFADHLSYIIQSLLDDRKQR